MGAKALSISASLDRSGGKGKQTCMRATASRVRVAPRSHALKQVIIHLAFYADWPKATSAVQVAKRAFEN